MAKARFVPGRFVWGTAHRATRGVRSRRVRSGSSELSVLGLAVWTVAFVIFFFFV